MISHFVKIMDDLKLFNEKTPKIRFDDAIFFGAIPQIRYKKMLILQYLGIIINIIFDSFILLSAHSWPYRFILGILFGSWLMANGGRPGPGARGRRPQGPGPGPPPPPPGTGAGPASIGHEP